MWAQAAVLQSVAIRWLTSNNLVAPNSVTFFIYPTSPHPHFLKVHASQGLVLSVTQSECLSEWHTFIKVLKFFTILSGEK